MRRSLLIVCGKKIGIILYRLVMQDFYVILSISVDRPARATYNAWYLFALHYILPKGMLRLTVQTEQAMNPPQGGFVGLGHRAGGNRVH